MSARPSSVQQQCNVNKSFIRPTMSNCSYVLLLSPVGNHTSGHSSRLEGSAGFRRVCFAGKTCLFLGSIIKIFRNRLEADHSHVVENAVTRNPYLCVASLHMQQNLRTYTVFVDILPYVFNT
jgi:hypothetical protein